MTHYVFVINHLSKVYPGQKPLFEDIQLSFIYGAKIGVVGTNGSGKTTLLRIMAGIDKDFRGEAWAAKGMRVGYLPQEPQLDSEKTVFENVSEGIREKREILERYNALMEHYDDSISEELAQLQDIIDSQDLWDLDNQVYMAMEALHCPASQETVSHLSGGEKRRVALCRLLLEEYDLLLLDEPTNHLDAHSISWLEDYLKRYKGTVVLITHDRYFLDHITGWILEIEGGRSIPYEGNYSAWLQWKRARLRVESKQESALQKQLARELEWVQTDSKGRQSKSKARIRAYNELYDKASQERGTCVQITIPAGPRLGDVVIEAHSITKSYKERILFRELSFLLPPGGIMGIVGPNGAGKTTLLRIIMGKEYPDQGSFQVGSTVILGYVDQSRDSLHDDKTVFEEIADGLDLVTLGMKTMPSRAYVGAFNFKGPQQQKKIASLSGGERNRVHLAKMLKTGANCLLLDEPTNDLDMESLRALEEALVDFPGSAVVVSHDRWFLDRVSTHILAFEEGENGEITFFEGGYSDYEADFRKRVGDIQNAPLRHKKLTRA